MLQTIITLDLTYEDVNLLKLTILMIAQAAFTLLHITANSI
jgi:hypothetical protein